MVPQSKLVVAAVGSQANIVCNVEAWPRPLLTWQKDGNEIFDSNKYAMVGEIILKY